MDLVVYYNPSDTQIHVLLQNLRLDFILFTECITLFRYRECVNSGAKIEPLAFKKGLSYKRNGYLHIYEGYEWASDVQL